MIYPQNYHYMIVYAVIATHSVAARGNYCFHLHWGNFADNRILFHPAAFAQCLGNNPLELAVHAPELIGSPLFKSLPCLRVHSQDKRFYVRRRLWHDFTV